jgi:hypothetical protein
LLPAAGVLPGCGPAGIPMHPNRTRLGGPQTAQSCWAAGSLDPQGVAPTAVEPPTPPGRPPSCARAVLRPGSAGGQPNTRRGFLAVYMDWRLGIYRRLTLSVWRFLCFLSLLFKLCMPRLLVVANPPQRGFTEAVIQRGDYNWMATETCYASSEQAMSAALYWEHRRRSVTSVGG